MIILDVIVITNQFRAKSIYRNSKNILMKQKSIHELFKSVSNEFHQMNQKVIKNAN